MIPYWILFGVFLAGALQFSSRESFRRYRYVFYFACFCTALMIGLRYKVGGDWENYLRIYNGIYFASLRQSFSLTDPGYAVFNWIGNQLGLAIWFPNLCCAALFTIGVSRLAMRQPNPWLALLVATPYLIIVVAMGYTRQAAAIGVVCFAIADDEHRSLLKTMVYIAVASLIHKAAAVMLLVVLVPFLRRNALTGLLGLILLYFAYSSILSASSDRMVTNYIQSNYDSSGAAVRTAMNVLAAVAFLLVGRKRMVFDSFERSYWTINSILALVCVPALFIASASSGIDRLGIFLIPLQMVVFSRLPYLGGHNKSANLGILAGVIFYSAAVQFVWLSYADNASYWLPYRTYLNG